MNPKKGDYPNGLWLKCDGCKEILYKRTIENNLYVCPRCAYHFRIGAKQYFAIILDNPEDKTDLSPNLTSANPLLFPNYQEKLKEAEEKSGLKEAYIYTKGKIENKEVVLGALDFNFMGGSMGVVVGEKVSRSIKLALEERLPLIIVATSGGARMQEGMFSLVQMANTAIHLNLLHQAKIPYISVLVNPCYAGVMASFASLGDIIIAEPGALLGFTGPRVIAETIKEKLPEGFQTAEFLLEHGFVDLIVPRKELKSTLSRILSLLWYG
uniref:Acetyl-coenzyme A carboxylase carboxyl transferase subunit beta n=1 Tax=candidate division WOR-3 bacterium TaxID=2052148 RepID=A0A7C3UXH1_UNCW3